MQIINNNVIHKNRVCGNIDKARNCYVTYRDETHIFHKFGNGFGCSTKILDYLISNEIEYVVINFRNMKGLIASVSEFLVHGEDYTDEKEKDDQIVLPGKYWMEKLVEKEVQATIGS